MKLRRLGKTELQVSEIGFGGEWLERHPEEDSIDPVSYTHLDVYKRQDGVYVTLYLVGEELFSCQTQMRAESLEQLLQSCTPDGSFFAFEDAQSRFDTLAPLSLLPGQTPAIHEASAANPCDARFSDALASSLGFNPYGDARYTDDAGNTT